MWDVPVKPAFFCLGLGVMRVGILTCGRVADSLQPIFGDYPGMFTRMLDSVDPKLEFEIYRLPLGEWPNAIDDCDVYLISGSKSAVFDDDDWIQQAHVFVRQLHQQQKKTVGICFGHQLIASALNGKVVRSEKGWGVGIHEWRIQNSPGWMVPTRDTFSLRVSHQDQVIELPDDAELLASSDFCPIAVYQIDRHFLAIQGHPEFSPDYAEALLDLRRDEYGAELVVQARKNIKEPVDDHAVATWMVNFLSGSVRFGQSTSRGVVELS